MPAPIIAVTYASDELNVFNHWRLMFEGVVAAGGVPLAIDCKSKVEEIETLVRRVDGLIIGGGVDVSAELYGGDPQDPILSGRNPQRDENEIRAWEAAQQEHIPVLAICRGAQLLTAHLGGDLYVDLVRDFGTKVQHRSTEDALIDVAHEVTVNAGGKLSDWVGGPGILAVNSQHHQGLKALPTQFTVTARSSDGLTEAFEWEERKLVGVQWHPEVMWATDARHLSLLQGFVAEADMTRAGRG